jgi:FixJ family two-component response regulator
MQDTGVYAAMIERCEQTGNASVVQDCRDAFQTLERNERQLVRAIIRGDTARTIWQRPR